MNGVFAQKETRRTNPIFKLKLIIDKNTKQFLFAEAKKDFVDFLFNIPSLPIASFLNLSQTDEQNGVVAEGSVSNLCNAIKNMDSSHFKMTNAKETLIVGMNNASNSIHHESCDHVEAGNYIVMDDLTVEPMSTFSLLSRLNKLGDNGSDMIKLEQKEVLVRKFEVERLLKESLVTKKVLSTVFLGDKYKDNEDAKVVGGQRLVLFGNQTSQPSNLFGNQTSLPSTLFGNQTRYICR